jgi:hypothetical protein
VILRHQILSARREVLAVCRVLADGRKVSMHKTMLFTLTGCLLQAGVASAHIQLISPPDRFTNNSLSPGPCGSGTRSTKPATKLVPGQSLVVSWKEVVSHPGHYRIALSAKESDFTDPTSLTIPNPSPSWVLLDGIADMTGNQTYSQSVAIPNKECPACVLQVLQVTGSGSDGTNSGSLTAIYHACADVSVSGTVPDAGVSLDGPGAHDARGEAPSVADAAVDARGAAGQSGSGGALASSGGASGASVATGGTGGHLASDTGSGGAPASTGGQGESGGGGSGGTTSDSNSRTGSVASAGASSSSTAGQGGGGHGSVVSSVSSGGTTQASGGTSTIAAASSATGSKPSEGAKTSASAGCHVVPFSRSSPWLIIALVLAFPVRLRRPR